METSTLVYMDKERALRTLGLEKGALPDDVNRAYRALIRRAHPDAGGSTAVAARITEAYHWLQRSGVEPLQAPSPPPPPQSKPPATDNTDDSYVLRLPLGEIFARLVEAGHQLGEVSYIDRDAGIVQVTFTAHNGVVCQLAATVVSMPSQFSQAEATVEFTLDPLASGEAPPIDQVVTRFARIFRRTNL